MTVLPLESPGVPSGLTAGYRRTATGPALLARCFAWVHVRRLDLLVLAGLLAVTVLAHGIGMSHNPERGDDEGTYVAQAWALQQGSLAHYTYWYDHPPLGWIQLAFFDRVTGAFADAGSAVAAARHAMLVVKAVSVAVLFALARRLRFPTAAAALAVALFALSPLAITYQRAVWLDNLAVMWLLAALLFAADKSGRMFPAVGGAACFGVAVLTKETTLLVAPFLFYLAWRSSPPATRLMRAAISSTVGALVVLVYPLMAVQRGELVPGEGHVSLLGSVHWQLLGRESSGSLFEVGSDAYNVVSTWFGADPVLLVAGLAAIVPAVLHTGLRPLGLCLGFHVLLPLRGGYLPVPYIIVVIPLIALCVAGTTGALAGLAMGRSFAGSGSDADQPAEVSPDPLAGIAVPARTEPARTQRWLAGAALAAIVAASAVLVRVNELPGAYRIAGYAAIVASGCGAALVAVAWLQGYPVGFWARLLANPKASLAGGCPAVVPSPVEPGAAGRASSGAGRRWPRLVGGAGFVAAVLVLLGGLAPGWILRYAGGDLRTSAPDDGVTASHDWMLDNVEAHETVIVEDTVWLDLVQAGFDPDQVVWFYKVDLDPGVEVTWRDTDYVSLHDYVADDPRPILAEILDHAEPAASFGDGIGRVTVWEVQN